MAGFFGTEVQQRLQAEAESRAEYIEVTAGACQSGRFLGSDDPDRLGWNVIEDALERDGIFGLRMIPAQTVTKVVSRFADRGFRVDFWDVFTADRRHALPIAESLARRTLDKGLQDLSTP